MAAPSYLQSDAQGVLLHVHVQPRAPKDAITGDIGGRLKIRIKAPPVDSAANEALVRFLADSLGCRKSVVRLVRGHRSRLKTLHLDGLTVEVAAAKLKAAAALP